MEFSSFTFIVTDRCNFDCSYCYQKKKGENHLHFSTFRKAFDFFLPYLKERCYINFTGGEPLLEPELIKEAVFYINAKTKGMNKIIRYSMTTNGSLIDEEQIQFLNRNRFYLLLSFDGIAHDVGRKKGDFLQIVPKLEKLLECPDIELATNSVFSPETLNYLEDSLKFIINKGIQNVLFTFSITSHWDESSLHALEEKIKDLKVLMQTHYKKTGRMPLARFRRNSGVGIFSCNGGKSRMAMTPDARLWGCYLLSDYFKGKEGLDDYDNYCFGSLDSFIENHTNKYFKILSAYEDIKISHCTSNNTSCRKCPDLIVCKICPVEAAISGSNIGEIPRWRCEMGRILRRIETLFWSELEFGKTDIDK